MILNTVMGILGSLCILIILELVTGPWKWVSRLMGMEEPKPDELELIQIQLLLEKEDLSINDRGRVICNACLRESCGFCNNTPVIKQAQRLLDKRNGHD